jgi:cytochrome c-type biogenesis protein CcsB
MSEFNQRVRRAALVLTSLLLMLLAVPSFADNSSSAVPQASFPLETVRYWAVQQGGRVKPMDTVARETVRSITGKEKFEKIDPVSTIFYWWAHGMAGATPSTEEMKVIEIRNLELKKKLSLADDGRWFSVKELEANATYTALSNEIRNLPPAGKLPERLSDIAEVIGKVHTLKSIATGHSMTLLPAPSKIEDPWMSLGDLPSEMPKDDAPNGVQANARVLVGDLIALRQAVLKSDTNSFKTITEKLTPELSAVGPYPTYTELAREVHYNDFHPFRKAWILYLCCAILLFVTFNSQGKLYWAGMLAASSGLGLHIYGFYLRCTISGRPPVTNMYESVIWVAFGAVLFSMIFEMKYRARTYLLSSTVAAVVCLILADTLPAVLDPSIRPLTPVLRSNFWLTIHVLTITLGYAAFLLSLGIGHMVLWRYAFGADQRETLKGLNTALYKSLQVGVLLLAAGTILGGVWANYSWGRFWGWDPKEVWALIALLGYLAILHGRFAGWLGHFGTAACSVLAFQGVLMAWYGVNFVLGAGLHSYGFGNGGVQYVGIFTLAEIAFVIAMAIKFKKFRGELSK